MKLFTSAAILLVCSSSVFAQIQTSPTFQSDIDATMKKQIDEMKANGAQYSPQKAGASAGRGYYLGDKQILPPSAANPKGWVYKDSGKPVSPDQLDKITMK